MEFTVRLSEQDYLDAFNLKRRSPTRVVSRFALVALACVAWLAVIGAFLVEKSQISDENKVQQAASIRVNILPAALVFTAFAALVDGCPMAGAQFRKIPN